MATKVIRAIQKVFGETGGAGEFGKIGSKAAGSAVTTKDITLIQDLAQYLSGLTAIVSDQGTSVLPYLEDLNSLFYLTTNQLAYLFQSGVPEWLNSADQRYYINSSMVQVAGSLYLAIKGDDGANINTQKDPETEPEYWRVVYNANTASFWDTAEAVAYDTPGVITDRFGTHYASSGKAANSGKDPDNPQNKTWWLGSPGWDHLNYQFGEGKAIPGGMHPHSDYSSGDYQQNLKIDEITRGGITYDIFKVQLDGTIVTGNGVLEAIFDPGGAKEYPWIDEFLPDNLAIRTLLDKKGTGDAAMTAGGGEFPTLAEMKEDQMQAWQLGKTASGNDYYSTGDNPNKQRDSSTTANHEAPLYTTTGQGNANMLTAFNDGTHGDIRSGFTTHGALLVRGVDYIIVIIAQ